MMYLLKVQVDNTVTLLTVTREVSIHAKIQQYKTIKKTFYLEILSL